jgi:hypothetical protein
MSGEMEKPDNNVPFQQDKQIIFCFLGMSNLLSASRGGRGSENQHEIVRF